MRTVYSFCPLPRSRYLTTSAWGWVAVCGMVVLLAGCGDGRPARVPVSGQVFLDEKPLTIGSIMLVCEGARSSAGKLDEQGYFTLTCYDGYDGVVIGRHKVKVMAVQQIDDNTIRWLAPKKYSDHRTSGLEVEITEATDSLNINLTSNGVKPVHRKSRPISR